MAQSARLAAALFAATALFGGSALAGSASKDGATAAPSPPASWGVAQASPSRSSLPNLSANANAIAIEHIKIAVEALTP